MNADNTATLLSATLFKINGINWIQLAPFTCDSLKVYAFDRTIASISLTFEGAYLDSTRGARIKLRGELNDVLLKPMPTGEGFQFQGNRVKIGYAECEVSYSTEGDTLHVHGDTYSFVPYIIETQAIDLHIINPSEGRIVSPNYKAAERFVSKGAKHGEVYEDVAFFSDSLDAITITRFDTAHFRISGEFTIRGKAGTFTDAWFGFAK